MKKLFIFLILLIVFSMSVSAFSDCRYNGKKAEYLNCFELRVEPFNNIFRWGSGRTMYLNENYLTNICLKDGRYSVDNHGINYRGTNDISLPAGNYTIEVKQPWFNDELLVKSEIVLKGIDYCMPYNASWMFTNSNLCRLGICYAKARLYRVS